MPHYSLYSNGQLHAVYIPYEPPIPYHQITYDQEKAHKLRKDEKKKLKKEKKYEKRRIKKEKNSKRKQLKKKEK